MTSFNTPQLKLLKDYADAYSSLDMNNVEQHMSKDFKYQTFPKIPEIPHQSKEAHIQNWRAIFSLLTKQEIIYREVIEAPGKVIVHGTLMFHTIESTILDYDSLAILTIVEEDGQLKIVDYKDFCDPEKRSKLYGWAAQTLAKREA